MNSYTTGDQRRPAIAVDGAGDFIVVWRSVGHGGDGADVFGRRFDSTGAPSSGEFQVNSHTTAFRGYPAVAAAPGGGFVVMWGSTYPGGSGSGVFGQRFDSSANPLGAEFQVNSYTTSSLSPQIAFDSAGNFVVVWEQGLAVDVFAQRYDSAGAALGANFQVDDTPDSRDPAVATDMAGGFLVAWHGSPGGSSVILGRRYDSAGISVGSSFQVSSGISAARPSVAIGPAGFFTAWQKLHRLGTPTDGSGHAIFARHHDSSGSPVGPDFQVNTQTLGDQEFPMVDVDASGSFVVTWADVRSRSRVFARRYDSAGSSIGLAFQVTGKGDRPDVAAGGAGRLMFVWESNNEDGDGYGIFAQRYGVESPISGRRLVMRDQGAPTDRRIVFVARDSSVTTDAGAGIAPSVNGAFLHVYNNAGTGDSVCLPLPASEWVVRGDPAGAPTYRYKDRGYVNGPCNAAVVSRGHRIRVKCDASIQPIGYTLDEPQQSAIGVEFVSGTAKYCTVFGGTLSRDSAGEFRARKSPVPGQVCPTPPTTCP